MANNKGMERRTLRGGWLKLFLELIAVFVGITAGFFVNSYSEKRANRELEHKYLSSILTNLATDSTEIHNLMEEDQNNLDISRRVVFTMVDQNVPLDTALAVLQVLGTFNNLNLEDATYKSIIGSGYLGQIMNFETREQLVAYYGFLENIQLAERVLNDYITEYVLPYIFSNIDLVSGQALDGFDPGDTEFRNLTTGYYAIANQKMALVQSLDSMNHSLRETIALSLSK